MLKIKSQWELDKSIESSWKSFGCSVFYDAYESCSLNAWLCATVITALSVSWWQNLWEHRQPSWRTRCGERGKLGSRGVLKRCSWGRLVRSVWTVTEKCSSSKKEKKKAQRVQQSWENDLERCSEKEVWCSQIRLGCENQRIGIEGKGGRRRSSTDMKAENS